MIITGTPYLRHNIAIMDRCAGPQLHPELQAQVMDFLPPNEQALVGRLVSRGLGARLSNRTARFRQPLPPSAGYAAWQPHLHQAVKQLTFFNKLDMMSAAASSGSETNLEVAWGLLRPCLHPDLLLQPQEYRERKSYGDWTRFDGPDAGTAAVQAGHAGVVLPWLVRHRCPLHPDQTLEAAAQHCDLAGLQAVWQLLGYGPGALRDPTNDLSRSLAQAAGRLGGDAAIAKLTWLWLVALKSIWQERHGQLMVHAARGAAEAGSLAVLIWLRGLGLDLGQADCHVVLGAALRGGHVAVADWLVDEAGCPLPSDEDQGDPVWMAAAEGGHVEALRWLLGRGLPVYPWSVLQAAEAGHLEAVRFLHAQFGAELTEEDTRENMFADAAGSGSLPTAAWLLQAGCPMGPDAYLLAARAGDADMVVWLAGEARCPWGHGTLSRVIDLWPGAVSSRPGLHRAVEVLLGAGCKPADGAASSCVAAAAEHGDLVLLRRLHGELGVGFGRWTLAAAAEGGCEAVLEWLVGVGCVEEEAEEGEDLDPYARAAGHGDMATLTWLERLGVAFTPRVVSSAIECEADLPVVRWLVERGAPWKANDVMWDSGRRDYPASRAWFVARLGKGPGGH